MPDRLGSRQMCRRSPNRQALGQAGGWRPGSERRCRQDGTLPTHRLSGVPKNRYQRARMRAESPRAPGGSGVPATMPDGVVATLGPCAVSIATRPLEWWRGWDRPLHLFRKFRHNELRFCCGAARPKRRAEPQQNLPRIGGAGAAPPAANAGYVERHRGRLAPVLDLNRRG